MQYTKTLKSLGPYPAVPVRFRPRHHETVQISQKQVVSPSKYKDYGLFLVWSCLTWFRLKPAADVISLRGQAAQRSLSTTIDI